MPDAFMGIDIASRALRAFQLALNVTGHNLANVETEGYSRQRVNMQQTPPVTFFGLKPLTMGTGMFVDTVERIRDKFLDGRFLETNYEGGRLKQMFATLSNIEATFQEPGEGGIHNAMNGMFDAWSKLSANPADEASRLNVRLNAQLFVQRVKDFNAQFIQQDKSLNTEVVATIDEINNLGARVADLNEEIRKIFCTGAQPNDLLDQRDLLIKKLTDFVDLRTVDHPDGSKSVYIGSHALVDPTGANDLPSDYDAASSTIIDGTTTIQIRSGKLAGLFGSIVAVESYKDQLDALVNEVRTQTNALHSTGINLNGTTGIDFFAGTAGAGDLDLTQEVKDDLRNIAAGVSGEPGDGGLASSMAAIRDTQYANLGNRSPIEYFSDAISRLGQESAYYRNSVTTQDAILEQIDQQRQSVMGVNMDEELSNMMRYQRSYQAAARFLSILDQTTEELITQFGR